MPTYCWDAWLWEKLDAGLWEELGACLVCAALPARLGGAECLLVGGAGPGMLLVGLWEELNACLWEELSQGCCLWGYGRS